MKVLMTADAVGGVWTYALDLAVGLAPHGVEVVLAVLGPAPSQSQRKAAAALPNVELVELGSPLEWMPDAWRGVDECGERLLRLADARSVDLVHLNGYALATLPWRRPVVTVAHSCVVTWWQAVHGTDPPAEWDEYRRRVCAGLAVADAVVAPTAAFLRRLCRAHGPLRRTHVVHNGRDAAPFVRARRTPRADVVFACGRLWDAAKDMHGVDAVATDLRWPVRIAGDATGPSGRTFRAVGADLLGPLTPEAVADEMGRAAVFVHPSRYEPFGLAPLEAARAGCALVLADLPELRELWQGAAEFVPPGDQRALRAVLSGLIDDAPRRTSLATAACERATRYDVATMAAAYSSLFLTLYAAGPAARAVA